MSLQPLEELMGDLWAEIGSPRNPKTGQPIRFTLERNQHTFNYWTGPHGEMYAYTPHPDNDGNYWAWDYMPYGRGARSGTPSRWKLKNLVRCAHRKTARAKALARYHKANHKATTVFMEVTA
jgi:hypothetical protein